MRTRAIVHKNRLRDLIAVGRIRIGCAAHVIPANDEVRAVAVLRDKARGNGRVNMEKRAGGESVRVRLGRETQRHRLVRLDEASIVRQVFDGNRAAAIQLK